MSHVLTNMANDFFHLVIYLILKLFLFQVFFLHLFVITYLIFSWGVLERWLVGWLIGRWLVGR
jgi:hypothetical protein